MATLRTLVRPALWCASRRFLLARRAAAIALLGLGIAPGVLSGLTGCGPTRHLSSVPEELVESAQVPGMPHVRTWGDQVDEHFIQSVCDSVQQERDYYAAHPELTRPVTADILALSGGGENGALGAGMLCAWTERGDRPTFKLVTGISTGALIAPLAFIGAEGDAILREGYTTLRAKDVMKSRGLLAILNRDGIADTEPLAAVLAKWITPETLAKVAAEHAKGRRLLVATVNIEAQRPVIWNLGAIASSDHPDAPALFRQVMLASASIPAAFEPQYFKVEAGGQTYEEMHVDGGAMSQVFLWGGGLELAEVARRLNMNGPERPIRLWIIRNGRFDPEYKKMQALFMDITGRTVSTLIKVQGVGDMYRLYLRALENGMDFNLAFIPPEFNEPFDEPFDPEYMNALFELGHRMMLEGYSWRKSPPMLDPIAAGVVPARTP